MTRVLPRPRIAIVVETDVKAAWRPRKTADLCVPAAISAWQFYRADYLFARPAV